MAWLLIYNVMRVAGSSPAEAAWVSLALGAAVGLAAFAAGLVAMRRLAASGRVVRRGPAEIPSPSQLVREQRDAIALAWPALGALAAVALALGAYLAGSWAADEPGDRPTTTLILAAWNALVGLWLGDEALRLRRLELDGLDSVPLACGLTAVLAGVGLSRGLAEPAQVALIVVAGAGGAAGAIALWRLQGGRGLPAAAIAVLVVAALALILPLAL